MRLVSPLYVCRKATRVTPTSSSEGIFCRVGARRHSRTHGESTNRRRLVVSDARKRCAKHPDEWLGATAATLVSSSATDRSTIALAPRRDSGCGVPIPVNRGSLRLQVELRPEPRGQQFWWRKVPGRWLQWQNQCRFNKQHGSAGCGKERTRVFRFPSMSSIHSEPYECFKCHRDQEQAA